VLRLAPRDIPNIISVLRMLLTIPVICLLLRRQYTAALILFALAGLSDGLDGYLAKHFGWQSRLGGLLDPLADKVLLMTCFLVLGAIGLIPLWLVAAALCRDLVIMGGALYYHFMVEDVQPAPSVVSKLNTLLQLLLVILVIADAGPWPLPEDLIQGLEWVLLGTILASGLSYVYVWSRKAAAQGWRR
jgi:cardiolipin synthase (CMP-forming)